MDETNSSQDFKAFTVTLDTTNTYVLSDGYTIYVALSGIVTLPLLPSTGITGFHIYVNDVIVSVKSATVLNPTGSSVEQATVKLKTYVKINSSDTVTIKYFSGNLTDTDTTAVSAFNAVDITNNVSEYDPLYFDAIDWNNSLDSGTSNIGNDNTFFTEDTDIFKRELSYPSAEVILDTTPPDGLIIVNDKVNSEDGIEVRTFSAYAPIDTSTSGFTDRSLKLTNATVEGWQFLSSTTQVVKSFLLRMKYTQAGSDPAIGNTAGRVTVSLYSNTSGDIPNNKIKDLGFIQYDQLTASYQDFTITPSTSVTLDSQTVYWIVLSFESIVKSGVTSDGSVQIPVKSSDDYSYAVFESSLWRRLSTKQVGYLGFVSSFKDGSSISNTIMAQDILGRNLYEATNFGGSSNISRYERIGSGDAYILNMYFTPDSQTYLYPLVSSIDIGVTSSVSKNYSVEIKTLPTAKWQTLFINVSDVTTTDFIRYKFATSTRLSNIRVVYKGDYNTLQVNGGTLTIAGMDDWSDVTEVQVSHFSDYRDADQFAGSNARGWAPFKEGSTVYDWNITNEAGLWQKHSGITYGQPKILTAPSSSQAAIFGYNEIDVAQGSLIRPATQSSLATGDTILCTAVHNSIIYAGTRLGYLLQSSRGDYWTIVNTKNPLDNTSRVLLPPITALTSHAGSLYIGTKKTTLKSASLYKYQDKRISLVSNSFTENKISALATNKGLLYIATSGVSSSQEGNIYTFDGTDINNINLPSIFDETISMIYSTTLDTIVAGFSNGTVYKLTYDSNSNPSSWLSLNEFGSDSKITNISDDTSGKFLFVSLENSFNIYIKNLDIWNEGSYPTKSELYTNLTYKQFAAAGSTDYKNDRDFSFIQSQTLQNTISSVNFNTIKPAGIGSSYYTATFDFWIKSPATTTYQFMVRTNAPTRLSVDDEAITSATLWTTENNITSNTTTDNYSTSTVEFVEDNFYKVKLEMAVKEISGGITPTVSLLWKDNATDFGTLTAVPSASTYRPNNITSVSNVVNSYVGSSLDGFSYTFDPTFYESNKKFTYVRLKDEAGNYHNYQLIDGSIPYASLDDFIILGAEEQGGGGDIPLGTGKITFTPATITAGNTSEAVLTIAEAKSTTSVFAITTDGNSTSALSSVTIDAGSRSSSSFTITVPSTLASTINETIVTATLGDETYTGKLNINPADGGGGGTTSTTKTTTVIYQVKPAMSSTVEPIIYKSGTLDTIYSPKRKVRSTGNYVSRPFYVPTLTRWDTMSVLVLNKYNLNTALGLDAGTEVNVYVRTADSSAACLTADWSTAYSKSYINNSTAPASAETLSIDLQAYSGKFLQFYLELITATQGDSPEVLAVTVSYSAATGSYFFTKTFDSTDYSATSPAPTFRRGLLTSNQDKKDGEIVYGYTTDDRDGYKYDFARYTIIEPNKSFELETPSSTIKFAVLLTSIDGDPSIVYDFAVQLDAGDEDMKFMPEL